MATMNLQKFIALNNTIAKPEERVPLYLLAKNRGEPTDFPHMDSFFSNLSTYLEGIRMFGQSPDRLEDGYGERTYHDIDVSNLIAYLSRLGFERCINTFSQIFTTEAGWHYPRIEIREKQEDNVPDETYSYREVMIGEDSLDEIGKTIFDPNIEGGKGSGFVDVVGWDGKIIRKCTLLRISDLHPEAKRTVKQYVVDPKTGKETAQDVVQNIAGVDSELWLVVTPECQRDGWVKISAEDGYKLNDGDNETDMTLKSSPYLRTPLSFFAMRKHNPLDVDNGPYPNGTSLVSSNCPSHIKLKDYDEEAARMSFLISSNDTVGILARVMTTMFSGQCFINDVTQAAFIKQLDYLVDEKDPGIVKWRKEWIKLLGQYHHIVPTYEVADRLKRQVPTPTARNRFVGIDACAELTMVVDLQFNRYWAIIPEFGYIHNPRGINAGTEACTAPEPVPLMIKVLIDPKSNVWEERHVSEFPFVDNRGAVTFHREGISVEDHLAEAKLKSIPKFKPLPDLIDQLKAEKKRQEKESAAVKKKK